MLEQITFFTLLVVATWLFSVKMLAIRRNILLGQREPLYGSARQRWKNVLLLALGQKKMFSNPLVALLHLIVYAGFIIINLEVAEIVLDGLLNTHRLFLPFMGSGYAVLINAFECLAVLVIAACVVFVIRRLSPRIFRLRSKELDGWPRKDAIIILATEIVLMLLFLTMNAADKALQLHGTDGYHQTGDFLVSGFFSGKLASLSIESLILIERGCWWLHIIGIFAFLNYLPWSKHLHIILAFPNSYYARQSVPGKMDNMPAVQQEVRYAMEPDTAPAASGDTPRFGAKEVTDLRRKNLMDAYSCTECGRCTAACPAHLTGKSLSPRRIMMATRDRLEAIGKNRQKDGQIASDGKSLLHDYIAVEELRACTTCNACVEACPVSISPLDIILQLRRSLIMEESNAPQEWNALFNNIENNFAPWKFSPEEREKWTAG